MNQDFTKYPCYLAAPDQIDTNGKLILPVGTEYRWISQPTDTEKWFPNSRGVYCWVFQSEVIEGFELAPEEYPNGEKLVDDRYDHEKDELAQWEIVS